MGHTIFNDKSILITGGTGSFGRRLIRTILQHASPKKVVVFSRDEWKQSEMKKEIADKRMRYLLGDVRDLQRLQRAFRGIDIVIHAAALKQVDTLEYNPFEAVLTNVIGGQNIINAAIDQGVERVVALSTDKAVNPANLYGATKLCAEKLFVDGNAYSGDHPTRFCVVRYGNVVGSRGSVVPLFRQKAKSGLLPITDDKMTRFWITLDKSVELVEYALENMHGGEIFIPKIPSMKVTDLAKAISPDCKTEIIGKRPGEKLHEALMTDEEIHRTVDAGPHYVIRPQLKWWSGGNWDKNKALPEGFEYTSDTNTEWLDASGIQEMLKTV
jgi:UDP-N-acetylglucosamine 4,6-dehydratase